MWAPQGENAEPFLHKIASVISTAKGEGNIYLITPFPNSLAGASMADVKFLWRTPYMNDKWKTVIKNMAVTNSPVQYIKPWARTAITCTSP